MHVEEGAMNDNIQDVMTDSPCAVNLTASIATAARAMREARFPDRQEGTMMTDRESDCEVDESVKDISIPQSAR